MADDNKMMHYGKRHWSQYERQAEPHYDEGNGATVIDRRAMTGQRVLRFEIVKSYVRESLSSLTPRHFWALSTTSLILTCVNSHLLTYVPLPLTTSHHRQCLIGHGFYYWIPV